VCVIIASGVLGPILTQFFALAGARGVTNEYWITCAGLLGGTAVALRYVDKRPWADVWLGRDAARPSLLMLGFAIGAFAIGVPTALLVVSHWMRNAGSPTGSWFGAAVRVSLTLLPAALLEELMTRGYILSVLRERWGWLWAIVATSVGFGTLHLANNGATAESVGLVTFAGFFLAAVVYATRSLYAAWMAHFAWNWTMAVVFHTAVSGYPFESPRYRYVDAGPDWATGGDWGPEGGIPAGLGMIAGMAFLFARGARRNDPRDPTFEKTLDTTLDTATEET
jgi:CAAX protease family protein